MQSFPSSWRAYHVAVRIFYRNCELPLQLGASKIIVRVEVLHPIAPSELEESVPSGIASSVCASLPTNLTVKTPNDLEAVVR